MYRVMIQIPVWEEAAEWKSRVARQITRELQDTSARRAQMNSESES